MALGRTDGGRLRVRVVKTTSRMCIAGRLYLAKWFRRSSPRYDAWRFSGVVRHCRVRLSTIARRQTHLVRWWVAWVCVRGGCGLVTSV